MLVKLLLKIVFKASLPLVAVAGIVSYGLYLKGGDPMSMWSTIASRTMGSIRNSGADTVQSVQALASSNSSSKKSTTVFTWVDASGTTHFGSTPPVGVVAQSKQIYTHSPVASSAASTQPASASALPQQESPEHAENLPGVAGVNLPINIKAEDLGLTQEELLEMINQ